MKQSDLEDVYGKENVQQWSQLDKDSKDVDSNRITKAIDVSLEKVQNRFRGSVWDVEFPGTVNTVTDWVAKLAAQWLYFTRGSRDVSDSENALNEKMVADETQVMQEIDSHLMGSRSLPDDNRKVRGPTAPIVIE